MLLGSRIVGKEILLALEPKPKHYYIRHEHDTIKKNYCCMKIADIWYSRLYDIFSLSCSISGKRTLIIPRGDACFSKFESWVFTSCNKIDNTSEKSHRTRKVEFKTLVLQHSNLALITGKSHHASQELYFFSCYVTCYTSSILKCFHFSKSAYVLMRFRISSTLKRRWKKKLSKTVSKVREYFQTYRFENASFLVWTAQNVSF